MIMLMHLGIMCLKDGYESSLHEFFSFSTVSLGLCGL